MRRPDIRPFVVHAAIEKHTFRLPLHRRLADALRWALIALAGH